MIFASPTPLGPGRGPPARPLESAESVFADDGRAFGSVWFLRILQEPGRVNIENTAEFVCFQIFKRLPKCVETFCNKNSISASSLFPHILRNPNRERQQSISSSEFRGFSWLNTGESDRYFLYRT